MCGPPKVFRGQLLPYSLDLFRALACRYNGILQHDRFLASLQEVSARHLHGILQRHTGNVDGAHCRIREDQIQRGILQRRAARAPGGTSISKTTLPAGS